MPAPQAFATSPAPNETLLARTVPVIIDIVEPVDGVNTATIIVTVNGQQAYASNSFQNGWTGSLLARPQGDGRRLVLNTPTPFPKNSQVNVTVNASSSTGIVMTQFAYPFFVQIEQVTNTDDVSVPRIINTGPFQLNGTVAIVIGSASVVGTSTTFLTQLSVNDEVIFDDDPRTTYTVQAIADNTHLTLTTPFNGTANPTGTISRVFLWLGYSKEPGNIILRKTLGATILSETVVVPGDDLSISYDPALNKFLLTYVHNGKVFLTTADVTDMPATLVQTSILRNEAKIPVGGDTPVPANGIPGISTFPPIKLVPPENIYSTQFVGDNVLRTLTTFPKFPETTFESFPYASSGMVPIANPPGISATWRLLTPTGIDANYKIGFNFIKYRGGVFSQPVFVPFDPSIPEFTEFNEDAAPVIDNDAYYCVQVVIRDPTGNVRVGPIHGFVKHPQPPAFGVPDTYSTQFVGDYGFTEGPTLVTFPPLKLVVPLDQYFTQFVGDSPGFNLSITGFGTVGVG